MRQLEENLKILLLERCDRIQDLAIILGCGKTVLRLNKKAIPEEEKIVASAEKYIDKVLEDFVEIANSYTDRTKETHKEIHKEIGEKYPLILGLLLDRLKNSLREVA